MESHNIDEPQEPEDVQLFDFSKPKKKKVKKAKTKEDDQTVGAVAEFSDPYTYDHLLTRIRDILDKNNPYKTKSQKIQLKPVQLEQAAKKKYKWTNFMEFTEILRRPAEHLSQFVAIELGVEVVIANEKLKMQGRRIDKEELQSILKKYILEYVKCPLCNSANTVMSKDANIRSLVMKCEACQSNRTVAPLKGLIKN